MGEVGRRDPLELIWKGAVCVGEKLHVVIFVLTMVIRLRARDGGWGREGRERGGAQVGGGGGCIRVR